MRSAWIFLLVPAAALAQEGDAPTPLVGARSLALSPDGKQLAFTYQGDIWVAPSEGGTAIPVTGSVELDDNPVWSPDGRRIAFSSNRAGNDDIYIVGARGGQPRRLTWHSGADIPSDWSPDGTKILFRASRDAAQGGIYELDIATGRFAAVFLDPVNVSNPKYAPDGNRIAYQRYGFPWVRPRYQGSAAAQLWIYDRANGRRQAVRNNGYQHLWSQWLLDGNLATVTVTQTTPSTTSVGKTVPKVEFTSTRTPNVYGISPAGGARALTTYAGDGVRFLTVARQSGTWAYERDGEVYVVSGGGAPRRIQLFANLDDKTPQEERLILTSGVGGGDLSPDGKTFIFEARGDLWSVPVTKGTGPNKDDATRLTTWEGSDDQPLITPDGKAVFFVSDRDGAEKLYRMDLTTKVATAITEADADVGNLALTPDKKSVSFWSTGRDGGLFTVPVEGGRARKVFGRSGATLQDYDWSPDGAYFAYSEVLVGSGYYYWQAARNIHVVETATGKAVNVTQLNAQHFEARWSPDGKYLAFGSNRAGEGLYVLPLQPESLRPEEIQPAYEKPKDPVKVTIDFDGIELRSRRILNQLPSGNLLWDTENGQILYLNAGDVWAIKVNGEDGRRLTSGGGISAFELTPDAKQLYGLRNGQLVLIDHRRPNSPITQVDFRADWTRDVKKERAAAYVQFWRAYNRGFYDPNFHGRDWAAIREKYRKFLPSIGHRAEMATVLNMMVGELESSHSEVGAAPPPPGSPSSSTSSHPGFSFDYAHQGPGLKVKEVPARAPGTFAGSRLNPGDVVMQINGQEVAANESLWRDVLNEQTGRELTMQVRGPDSVVRTVKYRAISGGEFRSLWFDSLLAARRRRVEEASGGRLTYVHIAGMSQPELQRFIQQTWQYAKDKKGLIIDVRNNGGGNTSDQIIDILERRHNAMYRPRDEEAFTGPGQVASIPMVVLMNETSFSNAEMFPTAMRTRGLAKLVGRPTPGYVIYTSGFRLIDGTNCRMPGTGVFRLDGEPLENNGAVPDIEVDITPEQFFGGPAQDPQLARAVEVLLRDIR